MIAFTLQCDPKAEPTAGDIAGVDAAFNSCNIAQCGRMSSIPDEVTWWQPDTHLIGVYMRHPCRGVTYH